MFRLVALGLALGIGLLGYGAQTIREDGLAAGGLPAASGFLALAGTAFGIWWWLRNRARSRGRHEVPWHRW